MTAETGRLVTPSLANVCARLVTVETAVKKNASEARLESDVRGHVTVKETRHVTRSAESAAVPLGKQEPSVTSTVE